MDLRAAALAIAGLAVVVTGLRLSRASRPYGTALLNVHKLIDLAILIAIGVLVRRADGLRGLSSGEWKIIATTALVAITALATGGVSSGSDKASPWVGALHKLSGWATSGVIAAAAYVTLIRG